VTYGPDNRIEANRFSQVGTRGGPAYAVNIGSSSHPIPSTSNVIVNNVFEDNLQGGLQVYTNATAAIDHNTFIRQGVWALHAQYCQPTVTVTNNLFHGNALDALNDSPGSCTVLGDHNQPSSVEPKLVNEAAGDYHLTAGSPAVNAGRTLASVTSDKDGVTRPQGSVSDIGAYELASSIPATTTKYRITLDVEVQPDGTLKFVGIGAPLDSR